MPHLLISSCSVDKPGVLTLRGAPNERQPWTPTPRIAIDVHTICWYMIGTPYGGRFPPVVVALPDHGDAVRCESGYILPFTVGTSFGIIHFVASTGSSDRRSCDTPLDSFLARDTAWPRRSSASEVA